MNISRAPWLALLRHIPGLRSSRLPCSRVLDGPRNLATRAKLSNVTKGLRGEEKANTTRAAQRKKTANPKTSFRDFHSDVPLPQNKTGPSTSKSGRDGATTRASTFIKDLTTTIQDVTWPQIMYIFYASFGCVFLFHYAVNVKGCWGPSMLPTLDTRGNAVLISLFHHGGRFVQRGDLVSYVHPMHRNIRGIKRVIGLPGDLVLRDTPGEDHGEGLLLRVPEGHCWIVGDNLNWSRDSRHFGPLPLALIRGKVMARIKPWKDRKWFWRNDYVDVPEEVDGAG